MEPELIADYACIIGEGPHWHPLENRLYWTDIQGGRMYRYDPATNTHEQFYEGPIVGGFTVQTDGALLLFGAQGSVRRWLDGREETIVEGIEGEEGSRFNDVIADPMGRVYCGTMPTGDQPGHLYRLDTDGTITRAVENIHCSNGLGFTPDRNGMYYTDSFRFEIYHFDYDAATGALTNQRIFIKTPEGEGFPDGMTVDAEGYIWTAKWDGYMLVRYTPDAIEERRITFPVKKVSSLTFGGPNADDIYVTTAGGDKKETDGALAGSLFRVRTGIRGVPENMSNVRV